MNSYVLFAGGVIFGILVSLTVILRSRGTANLHHNSSPLGASIPVNAADPASLERLRHVCEHISIHAPRVTIESCKEHSLCNGVCEQLYASISNEARPVKDKVHGQHHTTSTAAALAASKAHSIASTKSLNNGEAVLVGAGASTTRTSLDNNDRNNNRNDAVPARDSRWQRQQRKQELKRLKQQQQLELLQQRLQQQQPQQVQQQPRPQPQQQPVPSTKIVSNVNTGSSSSSTGMRWSPGKQGTLDKFKTTAENIQSEFTGGTTGTATGTATSTALASGSASIGSSSGNIGSGDAMGLSRREIQKLRRQERKKNRRGGFGLPLTETTTAPAAGVVAGAGGSALSSSSGSSNSGGGNSGSNVNLPPSPHYHAQALRDHASYTGARPVSYAEVEEYIAAGISKKLPNMELQRAPYEKDNLKLHLCNDVFEAYSASYLTTKQHMLHVESEGYNLSWVNCEMASFIHMKSSNKFYHSAAHEGLVMQSLDVLDFSVIHLSAYERSSNKHRFALWKNKADMIREWHNIDPVIEAGKHLSKLNNPQVRSRKINYLPEAMRTVVIMPFLGGDMGAGHSKLNNRFEYLKTCFWSLYEFFPYITAGVTRQEDVDWGMKESGLPFYDLLLLPKLPKSAGLPVGTTQQVKKRLQDPEKWGKKFDYVFFTESDQIIIARNLALMYDHLKKYPGHMLLPHRLMPYSNRVIAEVHKRDLTHKDIQYNSWMNSSCCLPRQNCRERKTWLPLKEPSVPVINYYGLYVPLGNVNFLDEKYRYCNMMSYIGERGYCP